MNKLKVINLFAGPGSGKSTCAAYVYSKLKMQGLNSELVTEYAKQLVYSGRKLDDQLYITAKQHQKQKSIADYGQVPLIITDSPLLLGLYYGRDLNYYHTYANLVRRLVKQFDNYDIFIKRVKPYNPSGRVQTEAESDEISKWLLDNKVFDKEINGDLAGADELVEYIKELL